MSKMPRGFHTNTYEENLVCPHRDISCCRDCATAHEEIVEVYGIHYWITDPAERAELVRA